MRFVFLQKAKGCTHSSMVLKLCSSGTLSASSLPFNLQGTPFINWGTNKAFCKVIAQSSFSAETHNIVCFYESDFFFLPDCIYKWYLTVFLSLSIRIISLNRMPSRPIHLLQMARSPSLAWLKNISNLFYQFIHYQNTYFFLYLGYCK